MEYLQRPAVSNGLIVVKLKRDFRYRGYVYFCQYAQMSFTRH